MGVSLTWITYNGLILAASLLGGSIPLLRTWKEASLRLFISLGAGVLLGMTFLHLLPDSIEWVGANASLYALLGFLLLFVIEKFMMIHACEESHCDYHTLGLSAFLGLSLHSLVAGASLGVGLLVPELSFILFIGILLHQGPESFSLTSILLKGHYGRRQIFLILLFFSCMVPLGALLSYGAFRSTPPVFLGCALAFSAGTFLHISVSDLLPEMHRSPDGRFPSLLVFFLGLGLMFLVQAL